MYQTRSTVGRYVREDHNQAEFCYIVPMDLNRIVLNNRIKTTEKWNQNKNMSSSLKISTFDSLLSSRQNSH